MKRFALLAILFLVACATYDPYEPGRPRPQMRGETPLDAGVDVMPPPRWWRDYRIAEPLKLSEEQEKQLDALDSQEPSDLHRLRREAMLAAREFESALDADPPSTNEIVDAGVRLRKAREELLGLEVQRVAAERAVLSRDQWRRLQQELHKEEIDRYARGYPARGPWVYPGWGPRGWPPGWWWPWY